MGDFNVTAGLNSFFNFCRTLELPLHEYLEQLRMIKIGRHPPGIQG
jgi:hypothetical protein